MPLNEMVREELTTIITKLQVENKMHSRAQLETYYARFRDKFGPERIANLDGDELLNSTTSMAGNRESMMYWLEFKNDDEFPDIFGGIGGGNALKFGMFYSQSKAWITGGARAQREMTKAEALDYARAQRDQLVLGCEVLNQHSRAITDDDYREIQRLLAAASPSVVDTSWGHKYFSLLFPDLLDDLHNANHQRFHLIRMLQEPPTGEGRYICAGRFAAAARELTVPMNGLMSALYERDGFAPYRYWRIGTTAGAEPVHEKKYCITSDSWQSLCGACRI